MSPLADLRAQLARYDDEAFAALANRGLLRRAYKDLETQSPTVDIVADAVDVAIGGQRVRFDARGPAQATCSCPAGGICQHIIAAAIALKRGDGDTGDAGVAIPETPAPDDATPIASDAPEDAGTTTDPLAPLHAALLAFDADALRKHAGKPGLRWALQFVQDLDPETGVRIDGGHHIRIAFAHPRIAFRYMGGGLDAIVADAQPARIEKYRVAAVLAYQRASGVALAPLDDAAPRTAALDLGKDHALVDTGDATREDARARLRGRVRRLLLDCVELGLSHLSPSIEQRFATLAVWAQGADYPRLALSLRRLADHVEWLNLRAGGADEHRLCDELAFVHGLVAALDAAAARGAAPQHLVGRARNRYAATTRLDLIGLGAHAWRSGSGYVGLTMLFWSPADRTFFSATDARPELQRGFDPVARYRAAGPWSGLGAPQQATGRELTLDNAQISAQGRLSISDATTVVLQSQTRTDAFLSQLPVATRWDTLFAARADAGRSLLAEPQPMRDWTVLRPARFHAPRFDTARQTSIWSIEDDVGDRIDLELPYTAYNAHAIDRIEAATDAGLPAGTCIVARLRPDGAAVAEPLSLIHPGAPDGHSPVDALHFDPPPATGAMRGLIGKAMKHLRRFRTDADVDDSTAMSVVASPPALRELRHALLTQAERGIGPAVATGLVASFDARLRRLRDAGFHAFPATIAGDVPLPEHVLRLHYLQLQYARLFGDAGGVE